MCEKRCARLVIHNTDGSTPDAGGDRAVARVAAAARPAAVLDDDGTVRLQPHGDSVRDRLLDVLLVVEDAQLDGTWGHLKACANDDCQWAFYDRSRNHGGTWCDMADVAGTS